jgi:formylglycine-generating enzyme required for sulfatase activity
MAAQGSGHSSVWLKPALIVAGAVVVVAAGVVAAVALLPPRSSQENAPQQLVAAKGGSGLAVAEKKAATPGQDVAQAKPVPGQGPAQKKPAPEQGEKGPPDKGKSLEEANKGPKDDGPPAKEVKPQPQEKQPTPQKKPETEQPPALTKAPTEEKPAPTTLEPWIVNSIGMKLVLIPKGEFTMGSPKDEAGRESLDKGSEEEHTVLITRPFYMGAHEVTQAQYAEIMGNYPSWFSANGGGKKKRAGRDTTQFPVEQVSWDNAIGFCRKLSALPEEKAAGRTYHLPTEAEWEYACRGGASSPAPFHYGKSLSPDQANINKSLGLTAKVGSYPPNAFGLFDMHGNVSEWCANQYAAGPRKNDLKQDAGAPAASPRGRRVFRGGSWNDAAHLCRSAQRNSAAPDFCSSSLGFRVVVRVSALKDGEGVDRVVVRTPVEILQQKLKGGELSGRIAAVKALGKLGKAAAPAARAVCEATLDASEELRSEALESLEKVAPALYPHVVTLLVDKDRAKLRKAVFAIARLEAEGKPAAPVILHHLKRMTTPVKLMDSPLPPRGGRFPPGMQPPGFGGGGVPQMGGLFPAGRTQSYPFPVSCCRTS